MVKVVEFFQIVPPGGYFNTNLVGVLCLQPECYWRLLLRGNNMRKFVPPCFSRKGVTELIVCLQHITLPCSTSAPEQAVHYANELCYWQGEGPLKKII